MSHHDVRAIILRQSGRHFDPDVVDAFLKLEEHFIAVRDRLSDQVVGPTPASVTEIITESASPPAPLPGTLPPVLIVEDDEIVRDSLVKLLTQAGYTTLTARNGQEALPIITAQDAIGHF